MYRRPRGDWLRILIPILFLVGLNVQPENLTVREDLTQARLAEKSGQGHLAAIKLRDVLKQQPWRSQLWERLGLNELSQSFTNEGDQALATALSMGVLSESGIKTLGTSYQEQGKLTEALGVWKMLEQKDGSGDVLAKLADTQRLLGNFEESIQALRVLRNKEPHNAAAAYQLGLLLVIRQPVEALKILNDAATQDGSYLQAADEIRKAAGLVSLNQDVGYQMTVYGRALANLGAWDLAKEAFIKATIASPEYAEGWAFLGEAQFQTGESGLDALNQAVKMNPRSVLARTMLALYWSRQEKWDEAIAQMQVAIGIEPDRAAWQMELGNLTARQGNLNGAIVFYQKATELEPNNVQTWQSLANFCLYYHIAERDTGLPAARQAVALDAGNSESLDLMGELLMGLGDLPGAERFFTQAAVAAPASAVVQLHLGQLYLQTVDQQKALDHLVRAQALDQKGQTGLIAERLMLRYFGQGGG
jgi:tetratricopeptide (TPR) repeat protein